MLRCDFIPRCAATHLTLETETGRADLCELQNSQVQTRQSEMLSPENKPVRKGLTKKETKLEGMREEARL